MRYLATAFAGEGPTDYKFLARLVERHVEALVAERGDALVEVGPIRLVLPDGRASNQKMAVVHEFTAGKVFADVLFVHTDAGKGRPDALTSRVRPIADALAGSRARPIVVGVVPDRETEAWMLADVGALERILGVADGFLDPVAKPREVHTRLDPKRDLRELVASIDSAQSHSARRRGGQRVERIYAGLADEVSFEILDQVPAFRAYRQALESALTRLEYFS